MARHTRDRDDDDYEPARRKPRGAGLAVAQIIVWVIAGGVTVLVGLLWLWMMHKSTNAIQETDVSAMAAAVTVGVYVIARSADKILGTVRSMRV